MTATLDRPTELAAEHLACAMHELRGDDAACGRPAVLAVVVHSCASTTACKACWAAYLESLRAQAFRCQLCGSHALRVSDLVWTEPLG